MLDLQLPSPSFSGHSLMKFGYHLVKTVPRQNDRTSALSLQCSILQWNVGQYSVYYVYHGVQGRAVVGALLWWKGLNYCCGNSPATDHPQPGENNRQLAKSCQFLFNWGDFGEEGEYDKRSVSSQR